METLMSTGGSTAMRRYPRGPELSYAVNLARASSIGCAAVLSRANWRVLAIVAGILVPRRLKNPEDLHESRPSPRTESLIASAVQWAERIMRRIEAVYR